MPHLLPQVQDIRSAAITLRVYDKHGAANFGMSVFFDLRQYDRLGVHQPRQRLVMRLRAVSGR
jgi:hypothetical protein